MLYFDIMLPDCLSNRCYSLVTRLGRVLAARLFPLTASSVSVGSDDNGVAVQSRLTAAKKRYALCHILDDGKLFI